MQDNPYVPPPKPVPDYGGMPPQRPVETNPEARQMAMLAHLLGALFGFIGPLIIWLVQKDKHPFVDDQGKEALNFHLTMLIIYAVLTILWIVVMLVTCGMGAFVPFPLIATVLQLVFGIIGTTQANNGEYYRYPLNIRFIQ